MTVVLEKMARTQEKLPNLDKLLCSKCKSNCSGFLRPRIQKVSFQPYKCIRYYVIILPLCNAIEQLLCWYFLYHLTCMSLSTSFWISLSGHYFVGIWIFSSSMEGEKFRSFLYHSLGLDSKLSFVLFLMKSLEYEQLNHFPMFTYLISCSSLSYL